MPQSGLDQPSVVMELDYDVSDPERSEKQTLLQQQQQQQQQQAPVPTVLRLLTAVTSSFACGSGTLATNSLLASEVAFPLPLTVAHIVSCGLLCFLGVGTSCHKSPVPRRRANYPLFIAKLVLVAILLVRLALACGISGLHVDEVSTRPAEHTSSLVIGVFLMLPMWRLDHATACVYSTLVVPAIFVGLHPAIAVQTFLTVKLALVSVLLFGTVYMIARWEAPSLKGLDEVRPQAVLYGGPPGSKALLPMEIPIQTTVTPLRGAIPRPHMASFGVYEAQGRRPYMEDRFVVAKNLLGDPRGSPSGFCAVYDGHNGDKCAEYAAKHLHGRFAAELGRRQGASQAASLPTVQAAFETAFGAVDVTFLNSGARAGSTALGLFCYDGTLFSANAGDTRAVLARKSGEDIVPIRLTQDHKPNLPDESARIIAAGGNVEFRAGCWRVTHSSLSMALAVSRALGDKDFKRPNPLVSATPEVRSHKLSPEDQFVVLASDGLWDVMSDFSAVQIAQTEIESVFKRQGSLDLAAASAARTLTNRALEMGSEDNVTVVIAMISC